MGSRRDEHAPRTYLGAIAACAAGSVVWGGVLGIGAYLAVTSLVEAPPGYMWAVATWEWWWAAAASVNFVLSLPGALARTYRRRRSARE